MKILLSCNLKFMLDDMFISYRPIIQVIDTVTNNGQGFLEFSYRDDINSYCLYKWYNCHGYPDCIDVACHEDDWLFRPIIIGVDEL